MEEYKEFTVTFHLDEYQQQQLQNIFQAYSQKGYKFESTESLFESLMTVGCTYDIAERFAQADFSAGLTDQYKTSSEVYQETKNRLKEKELQERIDAAAKQVMEQQVPEPDLEMEL